MDPITSAIVALAPALAQGLLTDIVKDSYVGLKQVIKRKFGESGALQQAVEEVEARPESEARAAVLEEEVATAGATQDGEVMKALAALLENLKKESPLSTDGGIHIAITGGDVAGIVGAHEAKIGKLVVGAKGKPASSE
ncbi:hypothetical protein E0H70_07355 [Rhizobium leguminosarum bv. viciae]|nr:hypothetical protein E0H70_07355 [Rhizobium leguminosarum bv. viciae]